MPENKNRKKKSKKDRKEQKRENFATNYGWALAFLEDYPELEELLDDAIKQTWSAARFRAEVMETKWYKKHADTARQTLYLMKTDPATYKQRLNAKVREIHDTAGGLGLEPGHKNVEKWAQKAMLLGWDETKLRNVLSRTVSIMGKNTVGGELAASMDQLQNKAYMNGININKKTMQRWLRAITRGDSTAEEYDQYIQHMAMKRFPNLAQEINSGLDVLDIADPYRQTMAELLEINPNKVDLSNKLLRRAISQRMPDSDDKGKAPQHRMMDLNDFEDAVRRDPRWQHTDNAKETMLDMGMSLLDMFGLSKAS